MKTVKKMVNFRYDSCASLGVFLEKQAAKGLILEKLNSYFWTFRKAEPQALKYTVTFFNEASVFNYKPTDNQEEYYDFAKECGWELVTQTNKLQVFCNKQPNPVPFDTDEREKFENIKRCIGLPYTISFAVLFILILMQIWQNYSSMSRLPLNYFSNTSSLYSALILLPAFFFTLWNSIGYFLWCKRSDKAIKNGGSCIEKSHFYYDIACKFYLGILISVLIFYTSEMFDFVNPLAFLIIFMHIPLIHFVFHFSIKFLKWRKVSSNLNRAISYTLIILTSCFYVGFLMNFLLNQDFRRNVQEPARVVYVDIYSEKNYPFGIFDDELPVTVADLYGENNYADYSYSSEYKSTIFMDYTTYEQYTYPSKDKPFELYYSVIEPKFDFVYKLCADDLMGIGSDYPKNYIDIDPLPFGADWAVMTYYSDIQTGDDYILFYEDKIIVLNLEEPITDAQTQIFYDNLINK